jgi:hypothetical protein
MSVHDELTCSYCLCNYLQSKGSKHYRKTINHTLAVACLNITIHWI